MPAAEKSSTSRSGGCTRSRRIIVTSSPNTSHAVYAATVPPLGRLPAASSEIRVAPETTPSGQASERTARITPIPTIGTTSITADCRGVS